MSYKAERWLNPKDSHATGSVVAFDGMVEKRGHHEHMSFLEIADCSSKVSLHGRDRLEFARKLRLLELTISEFADYLEGEHDE